MFSGASGGGRRRLLMYAAVMIVYFVVVVIFVVRMHVHPGGDIDHRMHATNTRNSDSSSSVFVDKGTVSQQNQQERLQLKQTLGRALTDIAQLRQDVLTAVADATAIKTSQSNGNSDSISSSSSSSSSSSDAAGAPELPYLIIGMPTVARPKADYLTATLAVLASQMPEDLADPLYGRVHIYVMRGTTPLDAAGNKMPHKAFDDAKQLYGDGNGDDNARRKSAQSRLRVSFFEVDEHQDHKSAQQQVKESPDRPGPRVRRQTRDVAALFTFAAGRSHYFMAMEDDFALCPHGLHTLHYALNKVHTIAADWLTIKVSYGMNGLLLHNTPQLHVASGEKKSDTLEFAQYLLQHQARRPPDHLQTEWAAGETSQSGAYKAGRRHFAYRYNLLHHAGKVSSLRSAAATRYAQCGDELRAPVLFEVDAFKPGPCGHDDVWPCHAANSKLQRTNPPLLLKDRDAPALPFHSETNRSR